MIRRDLKNIGGSKYNEYHSSLPHMFDLTRIEFELQDKSKFRVIPVRCDNQIISEIDRALKSNNTQCHQERINTNYTVTYRIYWVLSLRFYDAVVKVLRALGEVIGIPVVKIPQNYLNILEPEETKVIKPVTDELKEITQFDFYNLIDVANDDNSIDEYIRSRERNFTFSQAQRESIKFGIKHHGRVFLADERGHGKTLQALTIAFRYRKDFPCFIICPTELCDHWKNEILTFYPGLVEEDIATIKDPNQEYKINDFLNIISYHTATKYFAINAKNEDFRNVNVMILDEVHQFKNPSSECVKSVRPFLKKSKRIILCSGTPNILRSKELFMYLKILRPDIFNSYHDFAFRYCNANLANKSGMYLKDDGFCKTEELTLFLREKFMIRHLNEEQVRKRRLVSVTLDHDKKSQAEKFKAILERQKQATKDINDPHTDDCYVIENHTLQYIAKIQSCIADAKAASVAKHIQDHMRNYYILDLEQPNETKIAVFVKHNSVKEEIIKVMEENNYSCKDFTNSKQRSQLNIKDFKDSNRPGVCILSMNSMSSNKSFSFCNHVIFAELCLNPIHHALGEADILSENPIDHALGEADILSKNPKGKLIEYLIGDSHIEELTLEELQQKQFVGSLYFSSDHEARNLPQNNLFYFENKKNLAKNVAKHVSSNDVIMFNKYYSEASNPTIYDVEMVAEGPHQSHNALNQRIADIDLQSENSGQIELIDLENQMPISSIPLSQTSSHQYQEEQSSEAFYDQSNI